MANKTTNNIPPIVHLEYKAGETIIKEGDYGIAIYRLIEGKVEIYIEPEGKEVKITTLDSGQFFGEMAFITGSKSSRSASARAIEKTKIEVWHPDRISDEYKKMPFIIRHMANNITKRLVRMNKMMAELQTIIDKKNKKSPDNNKETAKRGHYRKDVDIECMYRPVKAQVKVRLWGQIKNISKTGIQMEIKKSNTFNYSHDLGDVFVASAFLPTGKRINVLIKIMRLIQSSTKGTFSIGFAFVNPAEDVNKKLGFFLMP